MRKIYYVSHTFLIKLEHLVLYNKKKSKARHLIDDLFMSRDQKRLKMSFLTVRHSKLSQRLLYALQS